MSLKDEIESYKDAEIDLKTGEVELWDHVIFPNVIRKRLIRKTLDEIKKMSPDRILDFGCGAGWLSKTLSREGWPVVGIDASHWLITNAMQTVKGEDFVVGDCMRFPFADGKFDCIVGSAVVHHLDPNEALAECYRVMMPGGTLILMEPNKWNPPAAFGRKITSLRTEDETPFSLSSLRNSLVQTGWEVRSFDCLFPWSFGISYLLKLLGLGNRQQLKFLCTPIEISERIYEKLPYLNQLGYEIFTVAKKI